MIYTDKQIAQDWQYKALKLQEQLTDLHAQVERLHADGAVMRGALEFSSRILKQVYVGPEAPTPYMAQDAREACLSSLSTSCGADLLARYREAVELVNTATSSLGLGVDSQDRDEYTRKLSDDWLTRRDTLLATVKGDVQP